MTVEEEPADKQNPLTVVRLLWCGQGVTTLVEIYNDGVEKEAADFLGLVDCGGDHDEAQGALAYIMRKVDARYRKYLNLVVLTRQDKYHLSLLDDLGARLQGIDARVLDVFVAGRRREGSDPDTVRRFLNRVQYKLDRVGFSTENQHCYVHGTPERLLWISEHNGTYFRILASNLTGDVASTVLVVDNGMSTVVLPGALTYQAMSDINGIGNLKGLLPPVLALVLPFHGVLATAVGNHLRSPGATAEKPGWKIINDFAAKTMSPRNIGISAGPENPFLHPVSEVVELFLDNVEPDAPHTYVSYVLTPPEVGGQSSGWVTRDTVFGIRSTVRALGSQHVYGDVVYRFTLREPPSEATVEFVPRGTRGTRGTHGADKTIVQAPEP